MKNIILPFDKRIVTKEEMVEHIKYYSEKADFGMSLHTSGDIKGAREIFKELRKKLQEEDRYYNKVSVGKYISKDNYYTTYVNGVCEAIAKQTNPNSNETLFTNLSEIHEYISNYDMRIFFED